MSDSVRLPVRDSRPQPKPIKHHHSARYYAHRVHESFTAKATKVLCAIFLFIFLFVGVFFFILWLSLHPHRPRFHTIDFTVPTLAQQSVLDNSLITFNVTARNPNQHMGTDCGLCLRGAIAYLPPGPEGGTSFNHSCIVRYELSLSYNQTAVVALSF
ncbi:ubiquitin family protein [Hibiscus syriacus]|uniref:Ubiquitin family protein n=1 Tax=Hibiscus syriacus TaxID=106335 RepID=A0A6A2WU87_HIBSY|nr:ubiquitin family protein [Hibiscus syriacus]